MYTSLLFGPGLGTRLHVVHISNRLYVNQPPNSTLESLSLAHVHDRAVVLLIMSLVVSPIIFMSLSAYVPAVLSSVSVPNCQTHSCLYSFRSASVAPLSVDFLVVPYSVATSFYSGRNLLVCRSRGTESGFFNYIASSPMCKWNNIWEWRSPCHLFSPSQEVLGHWEVPIYNDTYVMLFFGLLKKLVSKWLTSDAIEVSETEHNVEVFCPGSNSCLMRFS